MVVRRREPGQWKAGALAVLVHLLFVALLVFGVSWQNQEPAPIQVDLWSGLPVAAPKRVEPPPPEPPVPPEPPKPVKEVKPEPPRVEPIKADIALKAKEEKKRREEELKTEKEIQKREEEKKDLEKQKELDKQKDLDKRKEIEKQQEIEKRKKAEQEKADKLRRQQAEAAAASQARAAAAAAAAGHDRAVKVYMDKVAAKIKSRIINQPCLPLGDPAPRFTFSLMPTGELLIDPVLAESSGSTACDDAIARAIKLAQPFPAPDPELKIRDLNITFFPNRR